MRVHFVGVSGTGMGALAALFVEAGHQVSGSDVAFDPPIGPMLTGLGIRCLRGYDAAHLTPPPDLVVVGNAIRRGNVEAEEAERLGIARVSMSGALREHFLAGGDARSLSQGRTARRRRALCARGSCPALGSNRDGSSGAFQRGSRLVPPSVRRGCVPTAGGPLSSSKATSTTPFTGGSNPSSSTTSASAPMTSPS